MSLEVHRGIYPPPPDRINYPASEKHCLTLHVANSDRAEISLNNGKRRSCESYPGLFTFIPARYSSEWLWEESVELLEIYLPPFLLEQTAIASGDKVPQQIELIDRFAIRDPFLKQLAFVLGAELDKSDCELVLLSRRGIGLEEASRKGATVYTGDIEEPTFLQEALAGVDTFYLMFPPQNNVDDVIGHYQIILDNAIAAIKQHRIPRVVLQSSYGSHLSFGTGPIVGTYLAKQALKALEINFTAIRPVYFMENFLWFANSIIKAR